MEEASVTMREDTTMLKKSFDSSLLSVVDVVDDSVEELANSRKYSHRQTVAAAYEVEAREVADLITRAEETRNPTALFKETASKQAKRIRASSPFGSLTSWRIVRLIVKSGDDLRQEQLAMQLISLCKQIFEAAQLDLYVRPYEILATGPNCGVLECVPDAMSIDSLKKSLPPAHSSLREFFVMQFGAENSKGKRYSAYKAARKCFMRSLAAYSLICYILQIKDRHNGNILLDRKGHIIHIDFGFLLSNSPGGNIGFESAPFKLTDEFVEVLGGPRSAPFVKFRGLCVRGYAALRRQTEKIVLLVEMLRTGTGASMPCFIGGEQAVIEIRQRLTPRSGMTDTDNRDYINQLIDESLGNWRTRWYDRYQYWCQNIL
jgi:phosphatidylinositol 4-kinase